MVERAGRSTAGEVVVGSRGLGASTIARRASRSARRTDQRGDANGEPSGKPEVALSTSGLPKGRGDRRRAADALRAEAGVLCAPHVPELISIQRSSAGLANIPGSTLYGLLTVKKAKGGYRWVITCVTGNDITIDFHWFKPDNANEQQRRMKGVKYFWLTDLAKGFWQIRLHPNSRWLFCFSSPFGAKQYLRAPMGIKATLPFFDMFMAKILDAAGLLRKGVEMVHDDHAGFSDVVYNDDPEGSGHFHLLRRYLKMCSE